METTVELSSEITTKIYDQNIAKDVFESAEKFLNDAQELLTRLKERIR